jgi:hypothetical protein
MKLKFRGDYERIKKFVSRAGYNGEWRDHKYHQKQYRTDDGAILNWWASTGTITFGGRDPGMKFEKAFLAIASAKGRLKREFPAGRRSISRNATLQMNSLYQN